MTLLHHCLEQGKVIPGPHFMKAFADEGLTFPDAITVLKRGSIYDEPEPDIRTGEWKQGRRPRTRREMALHRLQLQDTGHRISDNCLVARSKEEEMNTTTCPNCGGEAHIVRGNWPMDDWGVRGYLLGVEIIECEHCRSKMPILRNVERLMRIVTEALIRKPYRLTGQEVRFLRKRIGATQEELGREMHVDKTTVSKWENDDDPVGIQSDLLLRLLAAYQDEELQQHIRPDIRTAFEQMREQSKRVSLQIDSQKMEYEYA